MVKQYITLQLSHELEDMNSYQVISYLIIRRFKQIMVKHKKKKEMKYKKDYKMVQQIHRWYIHKVIQLIEKRSEQGNKYIYNLQARIPLSFIINFARTVFIRLDQKMVFQIEKNELFNFINKIFFSLDSKKVEEPFELYRVIYKLKLKDNERWETVMKFNSRGWNIESLAIKLGFTHHQSEIKQLRMKFSNQQQKYK